VGFGVHWQLGSSQKTFALIIVSVIVRQHIYMTARREKAYK